MILEEEEQLGGILTISEMKAKRGKMRMRKRRKESKKKQIGIYSELAS